jgi:ATP-dependent DNA ligase
MIQPKDLFMLCGSITETELDKYKNNNSFLANEKFDGCRCICVKNKDNLILFSRGGNIISYKFSEITDELKKIKDDFIIDGEIISYDGDFSKLQRRVATKDLTKIKELQKIISCKFMVFDILSLNNNPLMNKPLSERINVLRSLFNDSESVKMVEYGEIKPILEKVIENNGEGIIVKDMGGCYESKRSDNWLKYKLFKETTITITGFTENPKGIRATDNEGNAVQIAGRNADEVKEVLESDGFAHILVQYLQKTKENKLRFISYRGLA